MAHFFKQKISDKESGDQSDQMEIFVQYLIWLFRVQQ